MSGIINGHQRSTQESFTPRHIAQGGLPIIAVEQGEAEVYGTALRASCEEADSVDLAIGLAYESLVDIREELARPGRLPHVHEACMKRVCERLEEVVLALKDD